jgi:hypothetical protein
MASPADVLPLDSNNIDVGFDVEPQKESPMGNEEIGEQCLLAEESSTAASSTGSTPAPVLSVALPLTGTNKAKEEIPSSQKPPKITPRGVKRIKPLRQKEGIFIQPWEFK